MVPGLVFEEDSVSLTKSRGSLVGAGITVLLAAGALGCGKEPYEERPDPTAAVFAEFGKRVDAYVRLRDSLAEGMRPAGRTKSQAEIAARATTLGTLDSARQRFRQTGRHLHSPSLRRSRTLIKSEYKQEIDSVVEQRDDAQEELPNFVPAVNLLYPTTYPLATFPATLLKLLPALPTDKVEYRIVTHYLILRDVEANLIIDFIPNAVP